MFSFRSLLSLESGVSRVLFPQENEWWWGIGNWNNNLFMSVSVDKNTVRV
jgi:hypothetical protein